MRVISSTSQTPDKSGNSDGGRDKDRTCDPYDVNTVAASLEAGFLTSVEPCVNPQRDQSASFIGHNLGSTAEAAAWLAAHPDEIVQPVIPFVRERFGLSPVQAIAALKTAHALRHGGA